MNEKNPKEFALEDFELNPISSLDVARKNTLINDEEDLLSLNAEQTSAMPIELGDEAETDEEIGLEETEEESEPEDPIFKELSEPKLPELKRENRAWLQMQSPNRIHFYWTFKQNPFQVLSKIFGNQTNYQLIVKLINQTSGREEIFPIDTEGSAWFDADADSSYRAEVGFYAVNRPFARVMFSNIIKTPRKNPSSRQDYSEYFSVTANQFAEILDSSGYSQDAFEVALAGDDAEAADNATFDAFSQLTGEAEDSFEENQASEIRFVLLALAAGYALEELRGQVSPTLFGLLQNRSESLSVEKALTALRENFDVAADEEFSTEEVEEHTGTTVFGISDVNFPRFLKRRTISKGKFPSKFTLSKSSPLSSLRSSS